MPRVFYVFKSGTLRRKENSLVLETAEGKKFIPVEEVYELFLFGEITLNTKLLNFLSSKGIVLHTFNHYGWYSGTFYPREERVSGHLLVKQVQHHLDGEKRLYLAKKFVEGAIRNGEKVLKADFSKELKALREAKDLAQTMSAEASFWKSAYKRLEELTGWEFDERTRRPPKNRLNALISFGNSLLYAKVLGEIYKTALNPTVSYLHEPSERRYSLSLDLSEVFKPLFVLKLIVNLAGKVLKEEHFRSDLGGIFLNEEGRKIFVANFDRELEKTFQHKGLRRKVSYRTLIRLELYKLIKHLLGERVFEPYAVG
jgi:CRISPR-associated protein Cas1